MMASSTRSTSRRPKARRGRLEDGTRCLRTSTRRYTRLPARPPPAPSSLRLSLTLCAVGSQLERYFNCVPPLPPKLYDVGSFALARCARASPPLRCVRRELTPPRRP